MDHWTECATTFIRQWRIKIGTLAMVLALVGTTLAIRPAQGDEHEHDEHEHHGRHWRAHGERHYHHGRREHRGIIYAPAPDVYYAPPPVVYAPPPPPAGFTFIFPFRIH